MSGESDPTRRRRLPLCTSLSPRPFHSSSGYPEPFNFAVSQLALGFSLLSNHREGRCEAFDYASFWSSSLAAAVAAEILARERRLPHHEELFTCGLLARSAAWGWLASTRSATRFS